MLQCSHFHKERSRLPPSSQHFSVCGLAAALGPCCVPAAGLGDGRRNRQCQLTQAVPVLQLCCTGAGLWEGKSEQCTTPPSAWRHPKWQQQGTRSLFQSSAGLLEHQG